MKKQTPKIPAVIDTYETEIEYECPVRGKVKQKVMVKRYESVEQAAPAEEILPSKNLTAKLDSKFSGLLISDDSLEEDEQKGEVEDGDSLH